MLTLKKNFEFQKVFQRGIWYGGEYLMIYVQKNNQNLNKIGIAVGRKVAKSVKRNRIRRLIREAYRLNEDKIIKGNNIVMVWKNGIDLNLINFKNIEKDLMKCLNKAKLIKNND